MPNPVVPRYLPHLAPSRYVMEILAAVAREYWFYSFTHHLPLDALAAFLSNLSTLRIPVIGTDYETCDKINH